MGASYKVIACLFAGMAMSASARAEVAVAVGHSVTLSTLYSIDQGCHSLGPVAVNLLEAPHSGVVTVGGTRAYPNFVVLNTRSRCNTMKLPATRVTYRSTGDVGYDQVTFEAIFPGGAVRRYRQTISVRPLAP